MKTTFGILFLSLFVAQMSSAVTMDDFNPEYKYTEITATYHTQSLMAYNIYEWSRCIVESNRGYGNVVGVFSKRCDPVSLSAQPRADRYCQKAGFDSAAAVDMSWLENPYLDYSVPYSNDNHTKTEPKSAYFHGDYDNTKPMSSFPIALTLDASGAYIPVRRVDMMSRASYGVDKYSSKYLSLRTDASIVKTFGPTSAVFKKIICASKK